MPNDKSNTPPAQVNKEATPPGAAQDDGPLTLTKAELQKLIDENRAESSSAARDAARKELEAERAEEQRKAAEREAREQGKWKEVADAHEAAARQAKEEADALRNETARERAANVLRRHVAETHPEYVQCCDEFMVPLLKVDAKTTPEQVKEQADAIAKRYAELNPRGAKGSAAPAAPTHGQRLPAEYKPASANGVALAHAPARRGF
jgi:hypothetical protein